MGIVKGGALRFLQTALYALTFICAAVILGIYSYFLAVQADRSKVRTIPTWEKAVEGMSGAAVLYLICAVLFTCCLGGISGLAFLAIVLDVLFAGAMIAIAVLTRHGASSCKGIVNTPIGIGPASTQGSGLDVNGDSNLTYKVSLRTACKLNTAVFAVSIIAAFLFLVTAAMQLALVRHHKKEKRYGPSPSNNYTSGFGKRKFWQRKPKGDGLATRDAEMAGGAGGLAAPQQDMRPSHETGYTGSTVGGAGALDKVDHQTGTGYHTGPTGTHPANPYTPYTTGTATNY